MAWGLFEKRDTESVGRVVSARTLDGAKIRVKIQLRFNRAMAQSEAEALMMKYARSYQRAVEGELSNGGLPFDEAELKRKLLDEVRDLPRANVSLMGLHLWKNGGPSSQTLSAISATGMLPTQPSMRGVADNASQPDASGSEARRAQPPDNELTRRSSRALAMQRAFGSAPTVTQPLDTATPSSPTKVGIPRGFDAVPSSLPAEAKPASGYRPTQPSVRLPRTRVSLPAWRHPKPGVASSVPPEVGRPPAAHKRSQPASGIALGETPRSGGAETGPLGFQSGFRRALESTAAPGPEALAELWADPLQRTTVSLVLGAMHAASAHAPDPMSWLKGGLACRGLVSACAACVSSLLYETLLQAAIPHGAAVTIVQQACRAAAQTEALAAQIGHFLGGNRLELLQDAAAKALAVENNGFLLEAFEGPLRAIELDIASCAAPLAKAGLSVRSLSPTG